ncbi:hypothetical protein QAD02_019630, partial [Eretmocerus hayati]
VGKPTLNTHVGVNNKAAVVLPAVNAQVKANVQGGRPTLNTHAQAHKEVAVALPTIDAQVTTNVQGGKPTLNTHAQANKEVAVALPTIDAQVKTNVEVASKPAPVSTDVGVDANLPLISVRTADALTENLPIRAPAVSLASANVTQEATPSSSPTVSVSASAHQPQQAPPSSSAGLSLPASASQPQQTPPSSSAGLSLPASASQPQQTPPSSSAGLSLPASASQPQQTPPSSSAGLSLPASASQPQQVNTACVCPPQSTAQYTPSSQVQNGVRYPYVTTIGQPMGVGVEVSEVRTYVDNTPQQIITNPQVSVQAPQAPTPFQEALIGGRFVGGLRGSASNQFANQLPQVQTSATAAIQAQAPISYGNSGSYTSEYSQSQSQQFGGSNQGSASISASIDTRPQLNVGVGGHYDSRPVGHGQTDAVSLGYDQQVSGGAEYYDEPHYGHAHAGASKEIEANVGLSLNLPSHHGASLGFGASKQIDLGLGLGKSFKIKFG